MDIGRAFDAATERDGPAEAGPRIVLAAEVVADARATSAPAAVRVTRPEVAPTGFTR